MGGVSVSYGGCWELSDDKTNCDTSACSGRKLPKEVGSFFCCCNTNFCNLELSVGTTDDPVVIGPTVPTEPSKLRVNVHVL